MNGLPNILNQQVKTLLQEHEHKTNFQQTNEQKQPAMKTVNAPVKRHYKTFDPIEAQIQAQALIDKNKKDKPQLKTIRIDQNTTIQIAPNRIKHYQKIVDKLKNKKRTVNIVEEIEYGFHL